MKENKYIEFQFPAISSDDELGSEGNKELKFQIVRSEVIRRSYGTETQSSEYLPGLFTQTERDKIIRRADKYSFELEQERKERQRIEEERLAKERRQKRLEHPNY